MYILYTPLCEKYDNLIPNNLLWDIYYSNSNCDFNKVLKRCKENCKLMGRSEFGCLQSCREHIQDRLFYLKNRNRNYLPEI